jgi:uncharacterized membrane protein
MSKQTSFALMALWCFVLSAGLLTGGSIFEGTVLTPLWSNALPESVMQWKLGMVQTKFFAVATPAYGLFSVALLVTARWLSPQQYQWALTAGICGLVVIVATFTFFLPILLKTQATAGAGLSGDESLDSSINSSFGIGADGHC